MFSPSFLGPWQYLCLLTASQVFQLSHGFGWELLAAEHSCDLLKGLSFRLWYFEVSEQKED